MRSACVVALLLCAPVAMAQRVSNLVTHSVRVARSICRCAAVRCGQLTRVFCETQTSCDGRGAVLTQMQVGANLYCDRDYTFSSVPDFLVGADLIQTANSDKRSDPDDAQFICFDLNGPSTVYVLHDSRTVDGAEPRWMQVDFANEHEDTSEVTDAGMGNMEIRYRCAEHPARQPCQSHADVPHMPTSFCYARSACSAAGGTSSHIPDLCARRYIGSKDLRRSHQVCVGGAAAPGVGSNYVLAVGPLCVVHQLLLCSTACFSDCTCGTRGCFRQDEA